MTTESALKLIERALTLEPGKWPYHRQLCDLSLRALNSIPDQAGFYCIKARLGTAIKRSDYFHEATALDLLESLQSVRTDLERKVTNGPRS